ncbi:MAG: carbohydrate ABC transporter permease [Spirochaetaceae bacterium]|jgi:raffinose/stachyose/melibiose transport system permease protein|nr:carbohydrate ABC transporter permease [Spirochaetaceae bacterium]
MSSAELTAVRSNTPVDKAKRTCAAIIANAVIILFSLSCLFPVVWMLYSSFKGQKEFNDNVLALPKALYAGNYLNVIGRQDANLLRAIGNSFFTTIIAVIFITLFGFITGYMLGRVKFRGNRIVFALFLLGMLIPIHSLMVPLYVLFRQFRLTDSLAGLALPYIAFGLPVAIFLVEGYIKGIPSSMEEAASIDGSSFHRTLFTIMLPMCRPILAAVAVIQTFAAWNEFSFALVLISNAKKRTVPLEIAMLKGQYSSNYPQIFATMLLAMIPTILFYFAFRKQIMKGMVAGAVKG